MIILSIELINSPNSQSIRGDLLNQSIVCNFKLKPKSKKIYKARIFYNLNKINRTSRTFKINIIKLLNNTLSFKILDRRSTDETLQMIKCLQMNLNN